jgi:hypothetical protein
MNRDPIEFNKKEAAFSNSGVVHDHGLTKYEYVSSMILASLASKGPNTEETISFMACVACDCADELFKIWEKRKQCG